ncbi:MAG: O-antigen ligase family protein [Clostridia bacterium]|nr:O-antigen ligase family protein [Clostridia bacterium]
MTDCKSLFRSFYGGVYYPILVICLAFLGHFTGFDFAFIALILLSLVPAFWLCEDARFAVMPILSVVFTVSVKDYKSYDTGYERFLNPEVLILFAMVALLLIPSLVLFLVRRRKECNRLSPTGIWRGCALLGASMLFSGAFSANYDWKNPLFAVLFSVALLAVYFLFAFYMRHDRSAVDYMMYCFLLAGILICAELIAAYFTNVRFVDGEIDKGSVVLGWGIWTAIGGMLAFLMPACFYFAASHKRGWIAFGIGLLEFVCIFLSQSRGALLIGALDFGLCMLYLLFKGKNRKQNRIFILSLAVVGAVGCIFLRDKIFTVLQNFQSMGLADNGRFEIWNIGWRNFLKYPVFGSGFYDSFVDPAFEHSIDPYLYHNTVIQMLGACGLVGFCAYFYHRLQTVRLVCKKPNPCKIFLGIALLSFLLFNLLDVLFFKFYPSFFYALMLLCMEKSEISSEKT